MTLPIPGVRGLSVVKTVVQIAAYTVISWTYAKRAGFGDEFVQGLRAVPDVLAQLARDLVGHATPGGGR